MLAQTHIAERPIDNPTLIQAAAPKLAAPLRTRTMPVRDAQAPETAPIAIVIPCYNEAQRLSLNAFLDFARETSGIHLIFVDDGSKDQTLALMAAAIAALPDRVDAVMMKENGGKAEAVRQGLRFAAQRGHRYIAFLDADLATPIDAILDFASVAERMPEIDIVFGSRKGGLGHRVHRDIHRKIISRICATLGQMATGLPIHDTQCGAKLFRNTPAFRQALEQPFSAGWLFDVELFLRVSDPDRRKRRRFFEYPVHEWTEIPGSKIKSSDVFKSGLKMLRLIVDQWAIRRKFSARRSETHTADIQTLRAGPHLSFALVSELEALIDPHADGVLINLAPVKGFDPSVFTALTSACGRLRVARQPVRIILPDDDKVIETARNTGLIATVDCVRAAPMTPRQGMETRFDLVDV